LETDVTGGHLPAVWGATFSWASWTIDGESLIFPSGFGHQLLTRDTFGQRILTSTAGLWFKLSDPAVEEGLYASASMRNFAGIDQIWGRYAENR
jgi:hypothetical protein